MRSSVSVNDESANSSNVMLMETGAALSRKRAVKEAALLRTPPLEARTPLRATGLRGVLTVHAACTQLFAMRATSLRNMGPSMFTCTPAATAAQPDMVRCCV